MGDWILLLCNLLAALFAFFVAAPCIFNAISLFGVQKKFNQIMVDEGIIAAEEIQSLHPKKQTAGVACSGFRRRYVNKLLSISVPSVIKGNYSEIMAMYNAEYFSSGVDADVYPDTENFAETARELALKYGTVILASGATDVVTDGERVVYIKNGTEQLASVTGTGCILGALCASFMTSANPADAAVSACCYLGICGELAGTVKGNGSFEASLMDRISTLGRKEISENLNLEEL